MKLKIQSKQMVKAATPVATKTAKSSFPKRASVAFIVSNFIAKGLDGVGAWVGDSINNTFLQSLLEHGERISTKALSGVSDQAIVLRGPSRVLAYKLSGRSGDTYERVHNEPKLNKKVKVRGSLALLEKTYGAKNVSVMKIEAAKAAVSKLNGARAALANLA